MGNTTDARVALLERLIDHAPLFPPASLELEDAVAEDARARESASSFVLGRFICPASRLAELPDVGRGVSVVLDAPVASSPRVEAVEAPPGFDPGAGGAGVGGGPELYVETWLDDGLDDRLDHLAEFGLRAKVRCGGASVPEVGELARFVRACRERGLVFKATAGLHHAVRTNGEHGFLNLLAAAVFPGAEEAALSETAQDAFALDSGSFSWRGRRASAGDLAEVRTGVLHSIGSCSFFEPVEELEALGVLPL
jgi:predicted transcriptional regulator